MRLEEPGGPARMDADTETERERIQAGNGGQTGSKDTQTPSIKGQRKRPGVSHQGPYIQGHLCTEQNQRIETQAEERAQS